MSSAAVKLKYVYRALQMNPAKHANDILDRRAVALGLPVPEKSLSPDEIKQRSVERARLQVALDSIRKVFWTSPVTALQDSLGKLEVDDFPELRNGVDRLKYLATLREQVDFLTGHPYVNANLLNTLKRVFMLPPREAGKLKQEFLTSLPYHQALPSIKTMVRMMADQVPQLYRVEEAWLNQILTVRPGRAIEFGDGYSLPGTGLDNWAESLLVCGVFALVLFAAFARVLLLLFRLS